MGDLHDIPRPAARYPILGKHWMTVVLASGDSKESHGTVLITTSQG